MLLTFGLIGLAVGKERICLHHEENSVHPSKKRISDLRYRASTRHSDPEQPPCDLDSLPQDLCEGLEIGQCEVQDRAIEFSSGVVVKRQAGDTRTYV